MSADAPIRDGQVLTGALFSEPMRVESVRANGAGSWVAGLVGMRTERFRRVALGADDIAGLAITDSSLSYVCRQAQRGRDRGANAEGCGRGAEFLRLSNALSALYPRASREKRVLDAMLVGVPR